ncbi:hypothetical protein F941_01878 [Acinetobacter bouvetii DSM 14964 = CIP 107468]|uniref:Cystatin domain-containing protein n=1 Tax=Acinetobacter bouvetii DSM 14964 = CIP 107468 TaxID=1120925 RepID=N9DIN7_9GAMM|nr:hypothetical protein [Acinetobacter bouvetii]ENV82494.1 hypothetical protein F941_01878 [Acinetobacter bouvetii DSM 14964 = CIP 107468]BCU64508.1 hypothetical protein ACBO_12990 [Acinetobacter bouvetii]
MNHAVGAWSAKKTPLLGSPVWKTFDEIFSKLLGCEYTLTAYYEQVVAGTHYCFEVEVKPIYPNAVNTTKWALVFKPLEGAAVLEGFYDTLPIK